MSGSLSMMAMLRRSLVYRRARSLSALVAMTGNKMRDGPVLNKLQNTWNDNVRNNMQNMLDVSAVTYCASFARRKADHITGNARLHANGQERSTEHRESRARGHESRPTKAEAASRPIGWSTRPGCRHSARNIADW